MFNFKLFVMRNVQYKNKGVGHQGSLVGDVPTKGKRGYTTKGLRVTVKVKSRVPASFFIYMFSAP